LTIAFATAARAQSPVIWPNSSGSMTNWPNASGSPVFGLPVLSLPDFGNTAVEPDSNQISNTFNDGNVFTAPATGTYTTLHVYCETVGAGTHYFGIYPAPGGDPSGQTLIYGGTLSNCPGGFAQWDSEAVAVPVVAGQQYAITFTTTGVLWTFSGSGGSEFYGSPGGGPLPNTLPAISGTGGKLISVFLSKP